MESKDTSASFLNDPRAQSVGRLMTESRFHGDISHRRLFNKLFTRKQDGELASITFMQAMLSCNIIASHLTGVT